MPQVTTNPTRLARKLGKAPIVHLVYNALCAQAQALGGTHTVSVGWALGKVYVGYKVGVAFTPWPYVLALPLPCLVAWNARKRRLTVTVPEHAQAVNANAATLATLATLQAQANAQAQANSAQAKATRYAELAQKYAALAAQAKANGAPTTNANGAQANGATPTVGKGKASGATPTVGKGKASGATTNANAKGKAPNPPTR